MESVITRYIRNKFCLIFNMMLKENGKLLKLLVILWISKSSCLVAAISEQFGLSWKVSPGRSALGLQPEQAGAGAVPELQSFSRFLVLAVTWWDLFQNSVSETGSSQKKHCSGGKEIKKKKE